MSKIAEVRLTLAAFIYAIELDLKQVINRYIIPFQANLSFIQNTVIENNIKYRFNKEYPNISIDDNLETAIDFVDFPDIINIIMTNSSFLPKEIENYISSIKSKYNDLAPVRNRVMHTRPLLGGDFAIIYEFVSNLLKSDPISWKNTLETKNNIENDPSFVLTLNFPFVEENNQVIHNLPIPDFDETGFIGRRNDVEDIKKLVLTNKVVSILGDGGIGKTALALKVAYDILDLNEKCPFDLIIWVSAKTTMLTIKGISEINNTIRNYTGLIEKINKTVDIKTENKSEQDILNEIFEFFELFKTLLVIDNLETIQNDEVKSFLREAQMRCNIIITSRIGLGELEFPRKLSGLSKIEATILIRELARIRNSTTLIKLSSETLVDISSKLYFNPLALKWFVNTVETGITPHEVLNNKSNLLNFCLSNVYEKLSENAIEILNIIRGARRFLNNAEIIYLSEKDPIIIRKGLNELLTTSFVSREIPRKGNLDDITYNITEFAKDFLSINYTVSSSTVKEISQKLRVLHDSLSQLDKVNEHNEFSLNAISYNTANEKIAAKFLIDALQLSKVNKYNDALIKINEAKNLVPNYFENYRISAFIKAMNEDILGADEDYKMGLELEPENPRLLLFYSQFLLFKLDDFQNAFDYANKVYRLRPHHTLTNIQIARCCRVLANYSDAISIIESLLKTKLNEKDTRVARTELISLLTHFANDKIKVEGDYNSAFNLFQRATEVFNSSVISKNIDFKLIRNYCDFLLNIISVIPPALINEYADTIKSTIYKYIKQIEISQFNNKIILKYIDRFQDESLSEILIDESVSNSSIKRIGNLINVQKTTEKSYVFIESDKVRFFASKYDFINIKSSLEWKQLKEGELVEFEIGENNQGPCAKKIKILGK